MAARPGTKWFPHAKQSGYYQNCSQAFKTRELGACAMEVIHTPGHAAGSMSFVLPKDDVVFGGDVLFLGGVGRTDLPGGDLDVLEETIRNKFYTLPEQVVVYPGHGPNTTIHHERKHNPFVTS